MSITRCNSVADGNDKQREHFLGGSYDFGMFKLLASHQTVGGDTGAAGLAAADAKIWEIGGVVKVGAGNVHVAYGKLDSDARVGCQVLRPGLHARPVEAHHRLRRYQPYQQRRQRCLWPRRRRTIRAKLRPSTLWAVRHTF